jgi:hypothetical protein
MVLHRYRNLLFIALGLTVVGALLVGGVTAAMFTHTGDNHDNRFVSGELKINLDQPKATPYFNLKNIAPGDSGFSEIQVKNTGSSNLGYVIELNLIGTLTEGPYPLVLTIMDEEGHVINLDHYRQLEVGEVEVLIISWQMPEEAGNEYQNATAELAVTVHAEQRLAIERNY